MQERQVQFRRGRCGNTCLRGDYAGKASTIRTEKVWEYLPERGLRRKGKYNSGVEGAKILAGEGNPQKGK